METPQMYLEELCWWGIYYKLILLIINNIICPYLNNELNHLVNICEHQ